MNVPAHKSKQLALDRCLQLLEEAQVRGQSRVDGPLGVALRQYLERAGVIKINCDVLHTWMSAAIVIIESPYFAMTDGVGRFKFGGLPTGDYEVEVWHERLGLRRQLITVSGESFVSLNVVYAVDQIR